MPSSTPPVQVPETALRFFFAPIMAAYVIGSLPVLVPVLTARWLGRRIGGAVPKGLAGG